MTHLNNHRKGVCFLLCLVICADLWPNVLSNLNMTQHSVTSVWQIRLLRLSSKAQTLFIASWECSRSLILKCPNTFIIGLWQIINTTLSSSPFFLSTKQNSAAWTVEGDTIKIILDFLYKASRDRRSEEMADEHTDKWPDKDIETTEAPTALNDLFFSSFWILW